MELKGRIKMNLRKVFGIACIAAGSLCAGGYTYKMIKEDKIKPADIAYTVSGTFTALMGVGIAVNKKQTISY